jgi:transcriptional regulator with XRE-family HTH domain
VREDDAGVCRRLGERIRELRKERGLSQQGLAERAGGRTSAKHIGAVERGSSVPSATSLVRIAQGLEVTVGELFSTITPGQPPRLPRRTIILARESIQSLASLVDDLAAPSEAPGESAVRYKLRRPRGAPRR